MTEPTSEEFRRERNRLNMAKWRAANPERARENRREWAAQNRDKANKSYSEWLAKNPTWHRDYYAENKEVISLKAKEKQATFPSYGREWRIRREYGITVEDFDKMLAAQNGVCKICHKAETKVVAGRIQPLSIDHCHKTGNVRGLLCYRCNVGIGFLQDDPMLLRSAANYLEEKYGTD